MWSGETLVGGPIDNARDYLAMDAYNASLVATNLEVDA
jgi:hypothetical protein